MAPKRKSRKATKQTYNVPLLRGGPATFPLVKYPNRGSPAVCPFGIGHEDKYDNRPIDVTDSSTDYDNNCVKLVRVHAMEAMKTALTTKNTQLMYFKPGISKLKDDWLDTLKIENIDDSVCSEERIVHIVTAMCGLPYAPSSSPVHEVIDCLVNNYEDGHDEVKTKLYAEAVKTHVHFSKKESRTK